MPGTALVIGGVGFIGQALCRRLSSEGWQVRTALRSQHPGVEARAALLAEVDVVIHAATTSTPASTQNAPTEEVLGNLQDLTGWIAALGACPRPLVYLSSAGSYYAGGDSQMHEQCLPGVRSYHGACKVAAEQFLSVWARQCTQPAVLVRPSNVYGPGQAIRPDFGIIPHAMHCLIHGQTLTIWGDGRTERDYLFVDDLAELVLRIIAAPPGPGAVAVNAAVGASTRLGDLLARLEVVSGRRLDLSHQPLRGVDALSMRVDPALARKQWGWQARTSLDEGLRATWDWAQRTL